MKVKLLAVSGALLLTITTVAQADPQVQVINSSGKAITVKSLATSTSKALANNGHMFLDPLSDWGYSKQVYFEVKWTDSHGNEQLACTEYGGKKATGYAYVFTPDHTCTQTAIMPVAENPRIENFVDVSLNPGGNYQANGYVLDPEGTSSLDVVITPPVNASWMHFQKNKVNDNRYDVSVTGVAPQLNPAEARTYTYRITATNNQGGSATQQVNVHVAAGSNSGGGDSGGGDAPLVPRTITAWLYDATNNGKDKEPGHFATMINNWNDQANKAEQADANNRNQITELYTYGSDMEMYKQGEDEHGNPLYQMETYYFHSGFSLAKPAILNQLVGPDNARIYMEKVPDLKYVSPIIDGRVDNGYMQGFNSLTKEQAEGFADLLAMQFCIDDFVLGPHIDVEPFSLTASGQLNFYVRLMDNLSGNNLPVCKGKTKVASVFTFASIINAALNQADTKQADAVKALLAMPNFMVVDSLYDLPADAPHQKPSGEYQAHVEKEVKALLDVYKQQPFNFKFGIPASCSFHECASDGNQVEYVREALEAIGKVNKMDGYKGLICGNPHFKGLAIWAFDYDPGAQMPVAPPSAETIQLIATQASKIVGCPMND